MAFRERQHVEVVRRDDLHQEYRENAWVHIENVRAALDKIPTDYRADAVFELHTWEDRDGLTAHSMTISYERPPTKAEIAAQMAEDRRVVANEIEWLQERAAQVLKEASDCGYTVADGDWPFKAELPNVSGQPDT